MARNHSAPQASHTFKSTRKSFISFFSRHYSPRRASVIFQRSDGLAQLLLGLLALGLRSPSESRLVALPAVVVFRRTRPWKCPPASCFPLEVFRLPRSSISWAPAKNRLRSSSAVIAPNPIPVNFYFQRELNRSNHNNYNKLGVYSQNSVCGYSLNVRLSIGCPLFA